MVDRQGVLWWGTADGLGRYDGTDVAFYTPKNSVMLGYVVWSLALDATGRVWVGTGGYGPEFGLGSLVKTDTEPWTVLTPKNSPLPAGDIYGLELDGQGNMWMATSAGLAVYREGGVILPGTPTVVQESMEAALPAVFSLAPNYPNPFNSQTVIRFDLPAKEEVELVLYNLAGQKVATLVQGMRTAGSYSVRWDGRDETGRELAAGVYLYRLQAGTRVEARKLLLLR